MSDVISSRTKSSAIYAEFFHPLRIERQLGMVVADRGHGTIAVPLQRYGREFSPREKNLLTLIQAQKNAAAITQGKSNEAIALILSISKRTVDKQVENILRKLGWNHAWQRLCGPNVFDNFYDACAHWR